VLKDLLTTLTRSNKFAVSTENGDFCSSSLHTTTLFPTATNRGWRVQGARSCVIFSGHRVKGHGQIPSGFISTLPSGVGWEDKVSAYISPTNKSIAWHDGLAWRGDLIACCKIERRKYLIMQKNKHSWRSPHLIYCRSSNKTLTGMSHWRLSIIKSMAKTPTLISRICSRLELMSRTLPLLLVLRSREFNYPNLMTRARTSWLYLWPRRR